MDLASNLQGVDGGPPDGGAFGVDHPGIRVGAETSPVSPIQSQVPKALENIRPKVKAHKNIANPSKTRCLKITEKVSINIASEASYVHIMSGKKLI